MITTVGRPIAPEDVQIYLKGTLVDAILSDLNYRLVVTASQGGLPQDLVAVDDLVAAYYRLAQGIRETLDAIHIHRLNINRSLVSQPPLPLPGEETQEQAA